MNQDELYHKLLSDLATLNLPVFEVDIELRPFSKTLYGRYFPTLNKDITPKIFIYPYMNKLGDLLVYDTILKTAIHEMVHHIQYCDTNFVRKKGVMHDPNFWKLYNHYINRAERLELVEREVEVNEC